MESRPLLEQIQDDQMDFANTLAKFFYVALVNLLAQKNALSQRAPIELVASQFEERVRNEVLSTHLKGLLEMRSDDGQGGCVAIPPEDVGALTKNSLEELRELIRDHLGNYAALSGAQTPAARDADIAAKGCAASMKAPFSLFNDKILENMGAACAPAGERKATAAAFAKGAAQGHAVKDFVGRILFIPMEKYMDIVDYDEKFDARKKVFPRCFCAPLLHVLRPLVIGREKYLLLNEALHTGIAKILGEDIPITNENCEQFLHGEKIYKHIMSLSLNILNVYRDESLRELLLEKVNDDLRKRSPQIPLEFNDRFCSILFKTWARFIYDQTPDFTNMKKTEGILRSHIPELFKPEEEAWVS